MRAVMTAGAAVSAAVSSAGCAATVSGEAVIEQRAEPSGRVSARLEALLLTERFASIVLAQRQSQHGGVVPGMQPRGRAGTRRGLSRRTS